MTFNFQQRDGVGVIFQNYDQDYVNPVFDQNSEPHCYKSILTVWQKSNSLNKWSNTGVHCWNRIKNNIYDIPLFRAHEIFWHLLAIFWLMASLWWVTLDRLHCGRVLRHSGVQFEEDLINISPLCSMNWTCDTLHSGNWPESPRQQCVSSMR